MRRACSILTAIVFFAATLLFVAPRPARANPAIVQSKPIECSVSTTCSVAFDSAITVGNYIVAMGFSGFGTGVSITFTDIGGNTFTQLAPGGNVFCNVATDGDSLGASYAKITTGGSDTVTIANQGHSTTLYMLIAEVSGLASSSVLDKTSTCTDTTAVSSLATSNITTTSANEMLIGFFGNADARTFTATGGYTEISHFNAGAAVQDEYSNVFSTGTYNASVSVSGGTTEIAGFVVSFVSAGGGPPPAANRHHSHVF